MAGNIDRLSQRIEQIDWSRIVSDLHGNGFSVVPGFLSQGECQAQINRFSSSHEYRKTVVMERYRFGFGVYKYWDYPLPDPVQTMREELYPRLSAIANEWMDMLRIDQRFPATFEGLNAQCHTNGQCKPTPLILKYSKGGFNTLHQDLYGDIHFPIQAALFLTQPGKDYTGGEFVLTQQSPRAQSKVTVLTPKMGDMIIFTTNFRPVKGSRGYYRVTMKHGVSEVRSGERYAMGIIFHDAVR